MDEGHFAKQETVDTLLGFIPENARYLIVSTPPTKESHIMNIINGVDDKTGKPVSKYIYLNYTCRACAKIQTFIPGHECEHNAHYKPRHLESRALVRGRAAYGNNTDAANRELYGMAISRRNVFIDPLYIERLRKEPRKPYSAFMDPPEYLYVSIDPSGSSRRRNDVDSKKKGSDYAIVSAFLDHGVYYVNLCVCFCLFFFYLLFPK